ncbi:MAG: hypothetical protein HQK54_08010 [Oligoflexales bacterium]|nr:hypothetical protein [Oligoflexales bacterium]
MMDFNYENPEILPTSKKHPRGNDIAVKWKDGLHLTYWDLWFLITTSNRFDANLDKLEVFLIENITKTFRFRYEKQTAIRFLSHVHYLQGQIDVMNIRDILKSIPEKLLKKESLKAEKKVLKFSDGDAFSEPMKNAPFVLLEKEAMRGEWIRFSVDPTPIAERNARIFLHLKDDFFYKGQTFSLSKRVEKAVSNELKATQNNPAACYAVYRAFTTLYHEKHNWDDSYGVMGDLLKAWMSALATFTPESTGTEPLIFWKDLIWMCLWEAYGCFDEDMMVPHVLSRSEDDRKIIRQVLITAHRKATDAFEEYNAEKAAKYYKMFFANEPFEAGTSVLRLVQ